MKFEDLFVFLASMYCFEFNNHCTCFALRDKEHILLARNSDFVVELEKLYMNCLYNLDGCYAFNGNTTAFVQMEDGINAYGLAVGLTFVYPAVIKPGLNAGMLVRYILEKCRTTQEALQVLHTLPIASMQTLTLADSKGDIAIAECSCDHIEVIYPKKNETFVVTANEFKSEFMKKFNNDSIDNWNAEKRYQTALQALQKNQDHFSLELAKDILKGKYGFMCQYDRKKNQDTVWSVIYDIKNKKIFRCEKNPSRKPFQEDERMKFMSLEK